VPKLRNIRSDPRVSLHLRGNEIGEDVVIVEGTARVDGGVPPADRVEDYVGKYQGQMAANGWTPESFAEDYVVPITVSPSRFRVW
jgi:PPOX class probable F420-dependent enzyme